MTQSSQEIRFVNLLCPRCFCSLTFVLGCPHPCLGSYICSLSQAGSFGEGTWMSLGSGGAWCGGGGIQPWQGPPVQESFWLPRFQGCLTWWHDSFDLCRCFLFTNCSGIVPTRFCDPWKFLKHSSCIYVLLNDCASICCGSTMHTSRDICWAMMFDSFSGVWELYTS